MQTTTSSPSSRPTAPNNFAVRIFILFAGIGAVLIAVGAAIGVITMRHVATYQPTEGTVIALDRVTSSSSSGSDGGRTVSTLYAPVVSYTVNGTGHTYYSPNASRPPAYAVGDRVTVLYDPANPDHAMIDSFVDRWLGALITAGIGLVFGLIGGIGAFLSRRGRAGDGTTAGAPLDEPDLDEWDRDDPEDAATFEHEADAPGARPDAGRTATSAMDPTAYEAPAEREEPDLIESADHDE